MAAKPAKKRGRGHPPSFDSPEQFEALANAFFKDCKGDQAKGIEPEIPTVNGLALALGCSRETVWQYGKKPEYSDVIKRVRSRLERAWEKRLAGNNVVGAIFWLKNQGWSDKSELDVKAAVSGGVSYIANMPKRG